jgi:hypothetical protein
MHDLLFQLRIPVVIGELLLSRRFTLHRARSGENTAVGHAASESVFLCLLPNTGISKISGLLQCFFCDMC